MYYSKKVFLKLLEIASSNNLSLNDWARRMKSISLF